jgi:hypothetical protein
VFDLEPYKFKKMNKLNLDSVISTLKSVFADAETEVVAEEKTFGEAALVDGTIVKWEGELMEGTALTVVLPEGEVAAPDGIHEVSDGTIIETAGGLVVNIQPMSEIATEDNEFTSEMLNEMVEKALAKYAEAFTATLEGVKAENEGLKLELAAIKADKETLRNEFSATLSKVGTELEEIVKSEAATSSKPQEFKAQSRAEKAAAMGAIIRANKLNK